jgi:hypothetical protein
MPLRIESTIINELSSQFTRFSGKTARQARVEHDGRAGVGPVEFAPDL